MKKLIEKIIGKLEEYRDENLVEHDSEMANHCKQDCNDANDCTLCVWDKAIEIVKQEAEKYNNGHFGCNTNGEHEKCNGCGLTDCKNRNKIWFGVSDDNNGWVLCSERMPEVPEGIDDDECPEFIVTIKGTNKATTLKCASDGTWFDDLGYTYDVIAWQQLLPYQPKGE